MVYNLIPIPSHGRLLVTAAAGPRTPRAFEQLELAVNPRVSRKEKKKKKEKGNVYFLATFSKELADKKKNPGADCVQTYLSPCRFFLFKPCGFFGSRLRKKENMFRS